MSSYIVSQQDIALLTEALYRYEIVTSGTTPDALGRLLWQENYASVNARYRENAAPPDYIHTGCPLMLVRNPLMVYKQVRHFCYQSCDHGGWESSEAARLMNLLEAETLRALGKTEDTVRNTPDWQALPWGLD